MSRMPHTQSPSYKRAPDEYFLGSRRYRDGRSGQMIVNVHAGDCFVTSDANEVAATVLGSCIAACIRDPQAGVGGMNHFLLPKPSRDAHNSLRFGAFAMEQLINEILKRGASRSRLEAKLFGGGHVTESTLPIGDLNAQFAIDYLEREGIALLGCDVSGIWPRKVRYEPVRGLAFVRKLRRNDDFDHVRQEERGYEARLNDDAAQAGGSARGNVELF